MQTVCSYTKVRLQQHTIHHIFCIFSSFLNFLFIILFIGEYMCVFVCADL